MSYRDTFSRAWFEYSQETRGLDPKRRGVITRLQNAFDYAQIDSWEKLVDLIASDKIRFLPNTGDRTIAEAIKFLRVSGGPDFGKKIPKTHVCPLCGDEHTGKFLASVP